MDVNTVRFRLDAAGNIGYRDSYDWTVHYWAAAEHLEVGKLLLGKGAKIGAAGSNGATALHIAAQQGQLQAVERGGQSRGN